MIVINFFFFNCCSIFKFKVLEILKKLSANNAIWKILIEVVIVDFISAHINKLLHFKWNAIIENVIETVILSNFYS